MDVFSWSIMGLSLAIWLGLWLGRGQFWRAEPQLERREKQSTAEQSTAKKNSQGLELEPWPAVGVVIPARNEAELLPQTLRSHLQQNYPGKLTIILVDDQSTDGTAQVAQQVAQSLDKSDQLKIVLADPLPSDWTGKLWAMEQGMRQIQSLDPVPQYVLFTDADIEHHSTNLRQLVTHAEQENLSLASLMVRLRCVGFWEQLLIPAFVFFFQKLYPFAWVNDPQKNIAAAAGGCILIRRDVLEEIGGLKEIRQTLIDDCALAKVVKCNLSAERADIDAPPHAATRHIWLGLSDSTHSLRPYPSLASIWNMVARTAFTQLEYSPILLLATLAAMTLIYLVPPIGTILAAIAGRWEIAAIGGLTWLLMTRLYWPMVRFYRCPPVLALCLPAIALLYTLMTADSALRHWQGRGGAWKGRTYELRAED